MTDSAGSPTEHGSPGREFDAFLGTLEETPPDTVTACRGWTTHEIVAHLASGAEAFANQVEAYREGRPVPEFGLNRDREPPYRAMDDRILRDRLQTAARRMTAGFAALLQDDPAITIPAVGWGLPIAELVTHMRQEFAIHRWDMVGDDDHSIALLGNPDLISHSVRLLGEGLLHNGLSRDPSPADPLLVRLRVDGQPDLVVDVAHGTGSLSLAEPEDSAAVIHTDAAARLIILWGRCIADGRRVRSNLSVDDLSRLQTVLAGY